MLELPPVPPGVRSLTNPEADRLDALDPAPWTVRNCITCAGKGSFRWYAGGRSGEIAEWRCACRDQYALYRYLRYCGLTRHYQRLGWDDAEGISPSAGAFIGDYVEAKTVNVRSGLGLVLRGPNGCGKTMISTLLLKNLLETPGTEGYFTTFGEMMEMFSHTWRSEDERRWFHRTVKNTGVLVLDDIGREGYRRKSLAETIFDEVLRHRVASDLPTIITTNLSDDELASYGRGIMSLLTEASRTYHFEGTNDFRPVAYRRRDEEARAGLIRPIVMF